MAEYYFVLCIAAVLFQTTLAKNNVSKETLYVLTQLPYPVPNSVGQLPTWTEGVNIIPALNLAARQINSEQDLLPNHNLELVHINGGCDYIDIAVANFTEAVTTLAKENRRFVSLIGPGCSRSTFGIAPLINRPDFNMITLHGAGASIYSNRTTYPYLFGSLGSVKSFGELSVTLMRNANWRKIAILFHSRLYYSSLMKEISDAVTDEFKSSENPAEILYSSLVQLDTFLPLADVQRSRARIIFVMVPPEHLRQIMCLAYHSGMIYPAYQWVCAVEITLDEFIASADNVSFVYNESRYNCSHEQFEAALNNSFFMNYRLVPLKSAQDEYSVANLTYDEYLEMYEEEVEEYNSDDANPFRDISTTVWAAYFYDSLWALAIALHNVTQKYNVSLSDYQYEDESITKLIAEELYNVNLVGNSGPINFNRATGFVEREIDLTQIINYEEHFTAYGNAGQIVKVRSFESIEDEFEAQNFPAHQAVAALYAIITFIQIVVVFGLHIATIVHRNESYIKASSPKLNHIAFVGAYLMGVAVILFAVAEHPTISYNAKGNLCTATWAWLLPISFTLQIGPIVARTWRLYRIFAHYLDPGRLISNPVLITFVCILLAIDLTVAVTWTTVDPYGIIETESTLQVGPASFIMVRLGCRCQYIFVWFGIVFSFKIATLVVLFVLALLTRNIKNQSYTTASLRVLGYLLFIVFVLGYLIYIFLVLGMYDANIDFSVLCITLNIMLLLFTVCIFIPPLSLLVRNQLKKKYTFDNLKLTDVKLSGKSDTTRKVSVDSQKHLM